MESLTCLSRLRFNLVGQLSDNLIVRERISHRDEGSEAEGNFESELRGRHTSLSSVIGFPQTQSYGHDPTNSSAGIEIQATAAIDGQKPT